MRLFDFFSKYVKKDNGILSFLMNDRLEDIDFDYELNELFSSESEELDEDEYYNEDYYM